MLSIGFRIEWSGCVRFSNRSYSTFDVISNLTLTIIPFIVFIFFITVTLRRIIKIGIMRNLNRAVYPVFIESTTYNLYIIFVHNENIREKYRTDSD